MNLVEQVLSAAKADAIPSGQAGPWTITKWGLAKDYSLQIPGSTKERTIPAGSYTNLWRHTVAKAMEPYGDLVMHDVPHELNTHLEFMLAARGRVLITGLGLGCVARGCLANPAVRHVVVIERDRHVLQLVGVHMMKIPRLTIIQADALEWVKAKPRKFDCAWHDLWSDPDKEEQHLQISHASMIADLAHSVPLQGAWAMARRERKLFRQIGINLL